MAKNARIKSVCEASSSEEPGAGIPHAGICAGGGARQRASLPRCFQSVSSASSATSAVAFAYSYLPGTDLLSGMSASGGFSWTREYEPHRDLVTSVENRHGTNLISRFDYANDLLARRTRKVR